MPPLDLPKRRSDAKRKLRRELERVDASAAHGPVAERAKRIERKLEEEFPRKERRSFPPAVARAALVRYLEESRPGGRILARRRWRQEEDARIVRALLELPAARGRGHASARAVATRLALPVQRVAEVLRHTVPVYSSGWRPFKELESEIRKLRRLHRKKGLPPPKFATQRSIPKDTPGGAEFHRRLDQACAAGEDLWTAIVRLYREALSVCRGCGAPLFEGLTYCRSSACRHKGRRAARRKRD